MKYGGIEKVYTVYKAKCSQCGITQEMTITTEVELYSNKEDIIEELFRNAGWFIEANCVPICMDCRYKGEMK